MEMKVTKGRLGFKIVEKASQKKDKGVLPMCVASCGLNSYEVYAGGKTVYKNLLHDS